MKKHLNTLYVTTQGAYVGKDGETVVVRNDGDVVFRAPIHGLEGIMCFGRVSCSPFLLGFCGERGVAVSFFTKTGRFLARSHGFTRGNVLLRRRQYRLADDPAARLEIARAMVTAKLANSRSVLQRAIRDHGDRMQDPNAARTAVQHLARVLADARVATSLDTLRGNEGEGGRIYFGVLDNLVLHDADEFRLRGRTRRPPLDRVNALLSFLYGLLAHDLRGACEAVGLDPAVGYLHADRPGRPSLALDLMEEFRAFLGDRTALSLINRRQLSPGDFAAAPTGAVFLTDAGRKTVLVEYQRRKQEELRHPFLEESMTVGMLSHVQARLLAGTVRGDVDAYPPFLWR